MASLPHGLSYAVGFDIGGTRIKAIALTERGERLAECVAATRDGEWVDGAPAFAWECRRILQQWSDELGSASAVGVAAPGVSAKNDRQIVFMVGRMQELVGFDFTAYFERSLLVPTLNDGQAALVGEAWVGAAQGMRDVALLTLGTGVGGAMMLDGRLIKGAFGRAGHFGHCCVDWNGTPGIFKTPGVVENYIGNAGVPERSQGRFQDTRELVEAVRAGEAMARTIWERGIRALACGIANIGNMIDPEAIIIGGGIAEAGAILWEPLEEALEEVEWRPNGHRVRLIRPELTDWAGAYGAARRAWQIASGQRLD